MRLQANREETVQSTPTREYHKAERCDRGLPMQERVGALDQLGGTGVLDPNVLLPDGLQAF